MNRAGLTQAAAKKLGIQKKEADRITEAFIAVLREALVSGERVQITGFGVFEPKLRCPRRTRNPATGEEMLLPEQATVVFRPSDSMKSEVKIK